MGRRAMTVNLKGKQSSGQTNLLLELLSSRRLDLLLYFSDEARLLKDYWEE